MSSADVYTVAFVELSGSNTNPVVPIRINYKVIVVFTKTSEQIIDISRYRAAYRVF